jgi:hypothetical protein
MRIKNDESDFADMKCFYCGDKAKAMWMGEQSIGVCYSCAVTILPALIADAVDSPNNNFENVLHQINGSYWKAVAANANYERRTKLMKPA